MIPFEIAECAHLFNRVKRKKEHGAKYDDNILQETEDEFEGDEA